MFSELLSAVNQNNLDRVEHLTRVYPNVDNHFDFAVAYASSRGYLEIVKYLCTLNIDIKYNNNYAIRSASARNHLEIVKYLILMGADVNAEHSEALRFASENGNFELVKYLISVGADINAGMRSALYCASKHAYSYSVVIGCMTYRCALHNLKNNGHWKVVKYLISLGAEVDSIDENHINELTTTFYNIGDFDSAIKLSKHHFFTNAIMKKSIEKIEFDRNRFFDNITRKNYVDIIII